MTVRSAATLDDALEEMRRRPPLLVFADLAPPGPAGLDAFLRLQEAAPETPIVVLSEFEDDDTACEAIRRGAQDCLVEGLFDSASLSRTIRHALARFAYDDSYRRSHATFQRTLAESDLPSLVADARGDVLYANPAAEEALGGRPEHVDWDDRDDEQPRFELAGAPSRSARAQITDTLWDGRLAALVTLEARPTDGASSPQPESRPATWFGGMASASPRMRSVFHLCERIAPSSAAVLILGETGTGKELVARAIHKRSGRSGHFVALDCGAVPSTLIDSELFGHERGAFTGANAHKLGLFRHAHRGTLLLDEVGNLPLASQHSLLRVLQEGVVRPLGGTAEVGVDVRIIAATSESLDDAVRDQRFRDDLLYRLDVIRVELLPLRERPEDVIHLLRLFLEELCERYAAESVTPGPGFLQAAVDYPWPGNVRQLENFAERILLTGAPCFSRREFHEAIGPARSSARGTGEPGPDCDVSLSAYLAQREAAYLEALLGDTHGSLQATADRAEIDPRTLRRKLKRHGIDRTRFLH